jgi:hypothetical protein
MKRALLLLVFLAACKSGEQKFCESAKADRFFDPTRPGLCEEIYRKLSPEDRACVDKCMRSSSAAGCFTKCNLGSDDNGSHQLRMH